MEITYDDIEKAIKLMKEVKEPLYIDYPKGDDKMKLTEKEALEKIEELKEYIKQKNKKRILVPDNIKIENDWFGDGLDIVFNDNKNVMRYDGCTEFYEVKRSSREYFVQCELIPVDESERIKGHTYFRTDGENPDFADKPMYCKYLGEDSWVFINDDKDCVVSSTFYKYWYKVVPVEDD